MSIYKKGGINGFVRIIIELRREIMNGLSKLLGSI